MLFLITLYACPSLFKIVGPQAKTSLPLLYYINLHDLSDSELSYELFSYYSLDRNIYHLFLYWD